jgi:glycosyltransferase involved in cell wall biosynthesis
MKKKLLIFSTSQFGYLTDTFKYCQYSKDYFQITYLCWDYNKPKKEIQDVDVKYIRRDGSLIERNFRLLKAFYKEIISQKKYLIFANYTPGISVIKILLPKCKILVDVRTLSVDPRRLVRFFSNEILKLELIFFKRVSVISQQVAKQLMLNDYFLMPLGGESFCTKTKSLDKLHLLYVGTLQGRNVLDCVKGLHSYLEGVANTVKPSIFFTIIGDSAEGELDEINEYIRRHNLGDFVSTEGYIPNENLWPFFERATVGVSYIPLTTYFDGQPPTKTYEYLLSGLPVIATRTEANRNIINSESGVLVDDTCQSFRLGIERIAENYDRFDSNRIRINYSDCLWKNIVEYTFKPQILSLDCKLSD